MSTMHEVWIVPPSNVQKRPVVTDTARNYYDKVTMICRLLASSAAAAADNDFESAHRDRHAAYVLCGSQLFQSLEEARREVCLDEDICEFCKAPAMSLCQCEEV